MMRLKGDDGAALDDGDGSISCSICLEFVDDNAERSWVKLQCSHRFHLDCIGSAFNAKGSMQCPNCRKIEKGQWLFAHGCRSGPEFSIDEWAQDEDLYNMSYSDLFGFHWCPFGEVAGEEELLSSPYQTPLQHALFTDHTSSSLPPTALPCPFITYLPIHPSSANSIAAIPDASNLDRHYHMWEHRSSAFSNGRVPNRDQSSSNRTSPDVPRSGTFMHPFVINHSSGSRPRSSVPSTLRPPYSGSNARTRDRVQALQAYYHSMSTRGLVRRHGPHMGMVPVPSSSDQTNRSYSFPTGPNHMHSWERDHLPSFLLNHVDHDSRRVSGSDQVLRHGSFRPRHRFFERTSSNTHT